LFRQAAHFGTQHRNGRADAECEHPRLRGFGVGQNQNVVLAQQLVYFFLGQPMGQVSDFIGNRAGDIRMDGHAGYGEVRKRGGIEFLNSLQKQFQAFVTDNSPQKQQSRLRGQAALRNLLSTVENAVRNDMRRRRVANLLEGLLLGISAQKNEFVGHLDAGVFPPLQQRMVFAGMQHAVVNGEATADFQEFTGRQQE